LRWFGALACIAEDIRRRTPLFVPLLPTNRYCRQGHAMITSMQSKHHGCRCNTPVTLDTSVSRRSGVRPLLLERMIVADIKNDVRRTKQWFRPALLSDNDAISIHRSYSGSQKRMRGDSRKTGPIISHLSLGCCGGEFGRAISKGERGAVRTHRNFTLLYKYRRDVWKQLDEFYYMT
jgi:hypothetical protein